MRRLRRMIALAVVTGAALPAAASAAGLAVNAVPRSAPNPDATVTVDATLSGQPTTSPTWSSSKGAATACAAYPPDDAFGPLPDGGQGYVLGFDGLDAIDPNIPAGPLAGSGSFDSSAGSWRLCAWLLQPAPNDAPAGSTDTVEATSQVTFTVSAPAGAGPRGRRPPSPARDPAPGPGVGGPGQQAGLRLLQPTRLDGLVLQGVTVRRRCNRPEVVASMPRTGDRTADRRVTAPARAVAPARRDWSVTPRSWALPGWPTASGPGAGPAPALGTPSSSVPAASTSSSSAALR